MGSCVLVLAVLTTFAYLRLALAQGPGPFSIGSERGANQHSKLAPKLGAVTSVSDICSHIGIMILRKGGNAADAMIATEFCVGVTAMQSTGIGGGGFMLIRASNGSYENVDFRETAPAAAFKNMYAGNPNGSLNGGLASGVPGVLRGLNYLYDHYATLPWNELMRPAIKLARDGFAVNEDLITVFQGLDDASFLTDDPAWAMDFAPTGKLLQLGDKLTRKRYADLLQRISENGSDVFYQGSIANTTITAVQSANGTMTMEDLRNYSVLLRRPLDITYRDFKITGCEGPCGGPVVLSALKTIEGYNDFGEPGALNISTHRLNEAIRFAYGARTELGDPSFVDNLVDFELQMLYPETAAKIRSKISDKHTQPVAAYDPKGIESLQTYGTSHVVTADASGMAVSLTSTINLWFGSHLIVPETGLIMNNEMNDFSIPGTSNFFGYIASPANYIEPGKRPLSSMSPLIVDFLTNNTLYYVLGGAGGSYIITATIQGLWNVLDRNMGLADAVRTPRFHDQLVPDNTEFEYAYDNATTAFMAARGNNVTWARRESDLQTLRRLPNGTFEAAAESVNWQNGGSFAV